MIGRSIVPIIFEVVEDEPSLMDGGFPPIERLQKILDFLLLFSQ
jgi:hypothetical protein